MMHSASIYAMAGVALFSIGISGVFFCSHPLRKILALNFASCGNFLIIVSLAGRQVGAPADPVPQALVLTGIVVAVSGSAVALTLYRRWVTLVEPAEVSDAFQASLSEREASSEATESCESLNQSVFPTSPPEL